MENETLSNSPEMRQQAERDRVRSNLLTGLGAGVRALGAVGAGVSSYNTAVGRAAIYSTNAASLQASIPLAQEAGASRVAALQQETGQLIASQRAAMAANGVVVDQDTGLEVMIQTAGIGARQVVQELEASRAEVQNIRARIAQQEQEAKAARREGIGSAIGSLFSAGETLLGAASTISNTNKKYRMSDAAKPPAPNNSAVNTHPQVRIA